KIHCRKHKFSFKRIEAFNEILERNRCFYKLKKNLILIPLTNKKTMYFEIVLIVYVIVLESVEYSWP
ncbi:MAG: hypothetical protein OQK52_00530, partial [Ignavibacteriaceae bacterium]|nr:hypothetical protein [Ignavibacteriaceae bacterium]